MEPLKFGNITLPHKAVFGPMAGFKIGRAHV